MAAKKTQLPSKKSMSGLRLRGQVAVVTGGSRGIGYAIARALAAEGCNVVITGRPAAMLNQSAAQMAKSVGTRGQSQIVPLVCDVRDPELVGDLT